VVLLRWKADEAGFAMPIRVGDSAHWTTVTPTTDKWIEVPWTGITSQPGWHEDHPFKIDTDHYYVKESWMESYH
jgi:hypothetical protein